MFCSTCGAETKEGLRYCNRCGANLAPPAKQAPPRLMTLIVIQSVTILVTIVIGLAMIFIFGAETMSRGSASGGAFLFLILLSLVVVTIVWLLVRQLSRLLAAYLETGEAPARQTKMPVAADITADAPQQIAGSTTTSPNLPPASTIPIEAEQMTRKFDEQK